MSHTYEIRDRGDEVPAGVRFALFVDGQDALYYSPLHRGIERVIERLKRGSLAPGGTPLAGFGAAPAALVNRGEPQPDQYDLGNREAKRARKAAAEDRAVKSFMTRGRLGKKHG